jgi:hypothetical protein
MDVIIVAHTEFGQVRDKRVVAIKDPRGVEDGVNNLLAVTDKYRAKVTLAVCPEAVPYVPRTKCEIGLHIHPGWQKFTEDNLSWFVGDMWLKANCDQSKHSDSTVLRDYPYAQQFQMIQAGKKHLKDLLGVETRVFVAGRWSLNNMTIKALNNLGFTHDCSAPASHKAAHYDWSKLPRIQMPYHPSAHDYQLKGDLPVLIVPISQLAKGGNVNPEVARTYGVNWLKAAFTEYRIKKQPLFHICLHSPAMCDPYFVKVMDELLGFIAKRKVTWKYASEVCV